MSKSKNRFPRGLQPAVNTVDETGLVEGEGENTELTTEGVETTTAKTELVDNGQGDGLSTGDQDGGEDSDTDQGGETTGTLSEQLSTGDKGDAPEMKPEEDEKLFEEMAIPENIELPVHLKVFEEYMDTMAPTRPVKNLTDWQSRLKNTLELILSLPNDVAVAQMRFVIQRLRVNKDNALHPAYRARGIDGLKLKGHKLREYEALVHTLYTISTCDTKREFAMFIDWESLRTQFTSKNSDAYTRVLMQVCGF